MIIAKFVPTLKKHYSKKFRAKAKIQPQVGWGMLKVYNDASLGLSRLTLVFI